MNSSDQQQPDSFDSDEPQIPRRLREGFSSLYGTGPAVPPEINRAILSGARARHVGKNRNRLTLRWVAGVAAAAAMLTVAVRYWPVSSRPVVAQVAEDINGDGRVDILDAYLLARRVQNHENILPIWDFNHDGAIDKRDVDVIAVAAVSLKGGP
jgi:hypothetical protein